MSPRDEVPGLVGGSQDKPGDLLLLGFPMGRDSLMDGTIVNLLQQSAWSEAAQMLGVTRKGLTAMLQSMKRSNPKRTPS